MKKATWFHGDYAITSYGNGLAYDIYHQPTGKSFYLQDEDAADWRFEYDLADDRDALDYFLNESMQAYCNGESQS